MPDSLPPLALYIHWPFCLKKCPYCDFNSHVRQSISEPDWQRALLQELELVAEHMMPYRLATVFFGGGTPSLMTPETVQALLDKAWELWPPDGSVEVTLEANPTSVEARKLEGFRKAGVNRLSMGVQALDDAALRFLGRAHSVAEALAAWEVASTLFPRTSFDLIYARPEQTPDAWAQELEQALTLAGEHLSLYQLTFEPGTVFETRRRAGQMTPLEDDTAGQLYALTQDLTTAAGFEHYEISNYARGGAVCQHNVHIWRYGDYCGVGPGAHSRYHRRDGHRRDGVRVSAQRLRNPESWRARTGQGGWVEETPLSAHAQALERLMLGLRLDEGVAYADVAAVIDAVALETLVEAQLLEASDRLRVLPQGRVKLDAVLWYLTDSEGLQST